jgi:FtsH-binding integral membrane protein
MYGPSIYILSAIVMFLFEYFVLLKIYRRSRKLEIISLVVAPLMIVIALFISTRIQQKINPFLIFFILVILELPLSLYGYQIEPDATTLERVVVAGSFGVVSILIAQILVSYF